MEQGVTGIISVPNFKETWLSLKLNEIDPIFVYHFIKIIEKFCEIISRLKNNIFGTHFKYLFNQVPSDYYLK